jgi:putative phosphoribosyl transferase
MRYQDRNHAGFLLSQLLIKYKNQKDVMVLGMARGGVPVAYEVAKFLHAPMDAIIVRKIGMPNNKEYAIGAIASEDIAIFDEEAIQYLGIDKGEIQEILQEEKKELVRREAIYRNKKPFPDVHNKIVILVDDGVATGLSLKAALSAIQRHQPQKLIVAVPVGASEALGDIKPLCDQMICPLIPDTFQAVGQWYEQFNPVEDTEVLFYLHNAT